MQKENFIQHSEASIRGYFRDHHRKPVALIRGVIALERPPRGLRDIMFAGLISTALHSGLRLYAISAPIDNVDRFWRHDLPGGAVRFDPETQSCVASDVKILVASEMPQPEMFDVRLSFDPGVESKIGDYILQQRDFFVYDERTERT